MKVDYQGLFKQKFNYRLEYSLFDQIIQKASNTNNLRDART